MLGKEISLLFEEKGIDYFGTDRKCDITKMNDLFAVISHAKRIEWIINCAAYTDLNKAEIQPSLAYSVNALGAGNVASIAKKIGARLIHFSTDCVFPGDSLHPYIEEDTFGPLCIYGETKAEGENRVREQCSEHFIIRTSWLYGLYGRNFVFTIINLLSREKVVGVVSDQKGCPTWARDLAEAILQIIREDTSQYGVYHFTDEGEVSRYEFAIEINRIAQLRGLIKGDTEIRPILTGQYEMKARLPSYSVLSKDKIRNVLGCVPPEWKTSLSSFINGLRTSDISNWPAKAE